MDDEQPTGPLTDRARELARPRTPLLMRLANAALSPLAGRLWTFDPDDLKRTARRATGLCDFGDDTPLDEPLGVLCRSLDEEADLHPVGRVGVRRLLVSSLVNRLRLEDLRRREPGVFTADVPAPVVIVGPPRSGTTFLHRLLGRDTALHTAPFWELWEPVPARDGRASQRRRAAAGRRAVAFAAWMAPGMVAMHQLDHAAPDEEIIALSSAFSSILYEWSLGVPAYAAWYADADHTAGYRYLRRVLQAMQSRRPTAGRWVTKAPQHLEQLGPLLSAFPDATVVHTHRDPVETVLSTASFITYSARTFVDRPDPHATGRRSADLVERLLRAAARDRDPADDRFVDVYFDDLCDDPVAVAGRVYAAAGHELTTGAEGAMRRWLGANRRGSHGVHRYAPEDFALDVDELRERFSFYYDTHPAARGGG